MGRPDASPWAGFRLPLFFCALALLISVFTKRAINGDGSVWLLVMMKSGQPFWFPFLFRPFDSVVQIPALAIMHFMPNWDWGSEVVWAWCVGYSLHPLPSLWLCWKICQKAARPDLFLFAAFGFAVTTLVTLANSVAVVPTGLSVFWPLLMHLLVATPSRRSFFWILLGSACLSLSHETALFGFLALAAIALIRAMASKKDRYFRISAGLFVICAVWLAYRAYVGIKWAANFQESTFKYLWGPYTWASIIAIGTLCAALISRRDRVLAWGAAGMILCYAAISIHRPDLFGTVYTAFNSRGLGFPLAAVVSFASFWAMTRSWWDQARGRALRLNLFRFVTLVLALAAFNETATSLKWHAGLRTLEAEVARAKGCGFVSDEIFERSLSESGIQHWTISDLSLLLQGTRTPSKILSLRSLMENVVKTDFCGDVSRGFYVRVADERFSIRKTPYMDFDQLIRVAGREVARAASASESRSLPSR